MRTSKKSEWKAVELSISLKENHSPFSKVKIRDSEDSYNMLSEIWDPGIMQVQEQLYALYLNRNFEVLGYRLIASGHMDEVRPDVRLIVTFGILSRAASVIIAHNHPSGLPLPSIEDHAFTSDIKEKLAMFDMSLHDHLILTSSCYYSFLDNREQSLTRGKKIKW